MEITIYGCRVSENGSLGAGLATLFRPWSSTRSQLTEEGIKIELNPADVWKIITPDGAKLSDDNFHLLWTLNGESHQSNANQVLALADMKLHGFRHK